MIDVGRRAELLALGAAQWRDPASTVRVESREALRGGSWPAPVVEAALDAALLGFEGRNAAGIARETAVADVRPVLVILSSNIIGPVIASAYCAAIAGASIILKSSAEERVLGPIVARQFERLGAPLSGTVDAQYWKGGDVSIEAGIFERVRKVLVFGDDSTCDDVRRRCGAVRCIAYGTAYSIGVVARGADLLAAADCAARDICMFDQRGCMSPQTIYVEGDDGDAIRFARALADGLRSTGRTLPRAQGTAVEAAAVAAWIRQLSVTAVAGRTHALETLLVGPRTDGCPDFVVAVESPGPPTCAGFGRIVSVKACSHAPPWDRAFVCDTVGFAGPRTELVDQILTSAGPARTCALGEMQRPPFGYRPRIEDFE